MAQTQVSRKPFAGKLAGERNIQLTRHSAWETPPRETWTRERVKTRDKACIQVYTLDGSFHLYPLIVLVK
jgi:hypothetical protein